MYVKMKKTLLKDVLNRSSSSKETLFIFRHMLKVSFKKVEVSHMGAHGCEEGYGGYGFGSGFALLIVLFILLVIIGSSCFGGGYGAGCGLGYGYGGW